jgi:lipopolysaccharide/colanic/teichoic acid biosynthesis glycosyltransferase
MAAFAHNPAVKRGFVTRFHYQLVGGFVLAIAGPALLRAVLVNDSSILFTSNMLSSILGTALALLLGFSVYRNMTPFPGIRPSAFVIPSFGLAYAAVFATYLFLRLDYSRFQMGASLMLAVVWFFMLSVIAARSSALRMAIVPGGRVDRLRAVRNVEWERLRRPTPLSGMDGLVVDLRSDLSDEWERCISDAALAGLPVYHVKQILESATGKVDIEHLSENTLGSLNPNDTYLEAKKAIDWVSALIALLLFLPVGLAIAAGIRFDSPGPALFRQTRVGYRGESFTVYKFRTMVVATQTEHAELDASITNDDDKRVTRLGRFLRRSRLDEVPQLFNILRGEMSWIGPRPEALKLSEWYEQQLPFYRYRHIVRPGITGWAQVNQGHVTMVDQVLEKLHYDFYYVKNFSLWLDILIVLRTVRTVLTGFGAR